jgi:hypothetical protein
MTIVVGPVGLSAAPVADVTVLVVPMNTSAVAETHDKITVCPGITSHTLMVVGLAGAMTWLVVRAI